MSHNLRFGLLFFTFAVLGCTESSQTPTNDDGGQVAVDSSTATTDAFEAVDSGQSQDAGREGSDSGGGDGGADSALCLPALRDEDGDGFDFDHAHCARAEDCNDADDAVHPESGELTGTPFVTAWAPEGSYDVDCDGIEEPVAGSIRSDHPCARVGNGCGGTGYIAVTGRTTPGANPYCGATQFRVCAPGPDCAETIEVRDALPCH